MSETAKELINRHARAINSNRRRLVRNRMRQPVENVIPLFGYDCIPFWQRLDVLCYLASSLVGALTLLSLWLEMTRTPGQ